jgi:hypothetical protein
LHLSAEQKEKLGDRDGRLARQLLRALRRARERAVAPRQPPDEFPLTEDALQAIAHKLGQTLADKRARRIIHRLIDAGVLTPAGSYRQRYRITGPSGYRVRLFRIGVRITARSDEVRPAATPQASPGKRGSVKPSERVPWYRHALFGTPDGLPPPCWDPRRRRRLERWTEQTAA